MFGFGPIEMIIIAIICIPLPLVAIIAAFFLGRLSAKRDK